MKRWMQAWVVLLVGATAAHGQLMSPGKAERLRRYFPRVDDPEVQQILDDPQLILYTEAEIPRAYQFWDGAFPGVHSAHYNISAGAAEQARGHGRGGNGNVEFPWSSAGGTHRCRNLFVVRFLRLPEENGRQLPIVWYRGNLRGSSGYGWVFPSGTVFGEVLSMRGPTGFNYTFELRTRTKLGNRWLPNVFRPFPTAESLAERIMELRPQWQSQPRLKRAVEHLLQPTPRLHLARLADFAHPQRRDFDQTAAVDELPELGDNQLVAELLTTTVFRSAEGEIWRVAAGNKPAYAPTTQASFHIVPRNYDAGFIAVDQDSCSRCHNSVNRHVDEFDSRRDWYGRVRGSDQIFSFHPFEPGSISYNGFSSTPRMRHALVRAGLLEHYDARRHPATIYQRSRVE